MNNTIGLINGSVLSVYPIINPTQHELGEYFLFVRNAHFFFEHRKYIYQDSRLFLSKVTIKGCRDKPIYATLGGYLEWWEHDEHSIIYNEEGEQLLIYHITGNQLFQNYSIMGVDRDGRLYEIKKKGDYIDTWNSIGEKRSRYNDVAKGALAYSIKQVKEILLERLGLSPAKEDYWQIYAQTLMEDLYKKSSDIFWLKKKLRETRIHWKKEEILHYHDAKEKKKAEIMKQLELLEEQKKTMRRQYPKSMRDNKYSTAYGNLCSAIRNLNREYMIEDKGVCLEVWCYPDHNSYGWEKVPSREEVLEVTDEGSDHFVLNLCTGDHEE